MSGTLNILIYVDRRPRLHQTVLQMAVWCGHLKIISSLSDSQVSNTMPGHFVTITMYSSPPDLVPPVDLHFVCPLRQLPSPPRQSLGTTTAPSLP